MAKENTIGLKITADGSQARAEINKTEAAAERMERKVSRPLRLYAPSASSSVAASSLASMYSAATPTPAARAPYRPMYSASVAAPFMGVGFGRMLGGVGSAVGSMASGVGGAIGSIASAGPAILGAFGSALGIVGSIAGTLIGAAAKFGGMIIDFLGKGVDMIMGMPMIIGKGLLAAGAAVAGGLYATHKALSPAGEMERYKTQLDFMGKSDLLGFYKQTALKSPLSLNETVSGGILAENYGLDSRKYLPLATDMASAFKVPLEELMRAFGYIKAGRTGEGMESMRRFGISNEALAKLGVKFEKSGEVADSSKAGLLDAIYKLASGKFSGMAEKQSGTYEGKISNLGDAIFQAFADGFEKALPYAKQAIQIVTDTIGELGAKLATVDWSVVGKYLVDFTQTTADIVKYLSTSEGMKGLGDALSQSFNIIMAGIGGVLEAVGVALYESLKAGGDWILGKMLDWTDVLVAAFNTGMTIWTSGLSGAFILGSRSFVSFLTAGLATAMPFLVSKKDAAVKNMDFGQKMEFYANKMKTTMISTKGEDATEAFNADMAQRRKGLGMGEGLAAWNKVGDLAKQLGVDAASPLMKFIEKAQADAAGKAATEKDKDKGYKEQATAIQAVQAAVVAGNALTSQMLREIQAMNEYSQSELAEAMIA